MPKTNANRDQQLLLNARQKLEEELSDLDTSLKEQKRKEQKLKKFLKEKSKEIERTSLFIKLFEFIYSTNYPINFFKINDRTNW